MATAKVTLIGLYNYDNDIFSGLSLPEYFDKQTLINTILLAGGEFPALYPDPEFMTLAVKLWSDKNQRYFSRLEKLMENNYEPLENYYRKENWDDTGSGSSESTFDNDTTDTDQVSAFNSSAFENRAHSFANDTGSSSGSNEYQAHREGYARGNIGVMSSQDMFKQELEVIGMSPYDIIAGDFINEFCLKVYV